MDSLFDVFNIVYAITGVVVNHMHLVLLSYLILIQMKTNFFLMLATIGLCLSSCNSDDIITGNSNNGDLLTKSVEVVPDTIELKFIYQGQKYVSPALGYPTHIDIQDPDVKHVYDDLQSLEGLTGLVRHDGFIEYFDNASELSMNFEDRVKSNVSPSPRFYIGFDDRNGVEEDNWDKNPDNYLARAFLYDDTNYMDRSCKLFLDSTSKPIEIGGLKSYDNFNDKCSSLKIQYYHGDPSLLALLVVYEDSHFRGHSFYFFADYYDKEFVYANLKYIFYDSIPKPAPRKDSWNDRISSCKFYFCRGNQLPEVG